ncbi:MAG: hypothetical protein CUN55_00170 [Phototrophicales bacterium]|nr:MAG: hypothetical protein CUN55_00170 [Phototrophicales bacterium]
MPNIFISYRRADTEVITGRIYDHLEKAFGAESIFKDVFNMPFGGDFRKEISARLDWCDILLVVIGPQYTTITDEEGNKRLFNSNDYVRFEVSRALASDRILVIPVLVNGAKMPKAEELPAELKPLVYRHAITVRNDPDFRNDMARLTNYLRNVQQTQAPTRPISSSKLPPLPEEEDSSTETGARVPINNIVRWWPVAAVIGALLLAAIVLSALGNGGDGDNEAKRNGEQETAIAQITTPQITANTLYQNSYTLNAQPITTAINTVNDNDWEVDVALRYPADWAINDDDTQAAIAISNDTSWVRTAAINGIQADVLPDGELYFGLRVQVLPTFGLEHSPKLYERFSSSWPRTPGRENNAGEPHEIVLSDGTPSFAFISYDEVHDAEWRTVFFVRNGVGFLVDTISNDHEAFIGEYELVLASLWAKARVLETLPPLNNAFAGRMEDGTVATLFYPTDWVATAYDPILGGQLIASSQALIDEAQSLNSLRFVLWTNSLVGSAFIIRSGTLEQLGMVDGTLDGMLQTPYLTEDSATFSPLYLDNLNYQSVYVRRAMVEEDLFELHYLVSFGDHYGAVVHAFSNENVALSAAIFEAMLDSLTLTSADEAQPMPQSTEDDHEAESQNSGRGNSNEDS